MDHDRSFPSTLRPNCCYALCVIINPGYELPEASQNASRISLFTSERGVTGGWISRDPIAEEGGINLYGYVLNNPIRLIDPLGLSWQVSIAGGDILGASLNIGYDSCEHKITITPAIGIGFGFGATLGYDTQFSNSDGLHFEANGNFAFGPFGAQVGGGVNNDGDPYFHANAGAGGGAGVDVGLGYTASIPLSSGDPVTHNQAGIPIVTGANNYSY